MKAIVCTRLFSWTCVSLTDWWPQRTIRWTNTFLVGFWLFWESQLAFNWNFLWSQHLSGCGCMNEWSTVLSLDHKSTSQHCFTLYPLYPNSYTIEGSIIYWNTCGHNKPGLFDFFIIIIVTPVKFGLQQHVIQCHFLRQLLAGQLIRARHTCFPSSV